MIAVQGNKEYTIQPEQADQYAAAGYDVYEGSKLVKHALNKTVPYAQYEKALADVERLKRELANAKKAAN